MIGGSLGNRFAASSVIPTDNLGRIFSITGNRLDSIVSVEVVNSLTNLSISELESPKPVTRFSQDAFVMLMEPSTVVAASFAVVPVISNSVWIT